MCGRFKSKRQIDLIHLTKKYQPKEEPSLDDQHFLSLHPPAQYTTHRIVVIEYVVNSNRSICFQSNRLCLYQISSVHIQQKAIEKRPSSSSLRTPLCVFELANFVLKSFCRQSYIAIVDHVIFDCSQRKYINNIQQKETKLIKYPLFFTKVIKEIRRCPME